MEIIILWVWLFFADGSQFVASRQFDSMPQCLAVSESFNLIAESQCELQFII